MRRILFFIRKEFLQIFRDPRMLWVVMAAPLIQLLAFGYIASTDIKHISTAVWDASNSSYSRRYLEAYKNSGYFDFNYYINSDRQLHEVLDSGAVKLVLHVPTDFAKKMARKETTSVQAVIDASNSASATIISGYINQVNFAGLTPGRSLALPQIRVWYNPELKSVYFMVPAIFALVLMIQSMLLTAFAIVREKERGTMEQLIVTPIKAYELILGKLLPSIIISFIDFILIFLLATLWFKVPLQGSLGLLFLLSALFLASGLGLGVFISTISHSQRQAMMSAIFVMIPSLILSGFFFPIANMPKVIQGLTYFIPVRYFLVILRGIFLKGIGLKYLWSEVWPLLVFGSIILTLSVLRFRKKIE